MSVSLPCICENATKNITYREDLRQVTNIRDRNK